MSHSEKVFRPDYQGAYTPEVMRVITQAIRDHVSRRKDLTSEGDVFPVVYGQEAGTLFISRDKNAVIGSESLVVDGVEFYIGIARVT